MTWLLIAALLTGLGVLRFFVGVPKPKRPSTHLSRGEVAFVEAAASAFLPDVEGGLARSGEAADLVGFLDRYLEALPTRERQRIHAMLIFFEHSTLLFPARGVGGFRRFSALDGARQVEVLEAWAASEWGVRRSLLTALRAVIVMGALSHPDNLRALELDEWHIESPIIETDLLYPEVGQPASSIAFGEADLTQVRDTTPLRDVGEGT